MKFLLVLHCETDWNDPKTGKLQGHTDIALNDLGRENAKILAAKIADTGAEFSEIISSDLKRARETAEIIGLHFKLSMRSDPRLRECKFGSLEGSPKSELSRIYKETGCFKSLNTYNFRAFGGETNEEVFLRQLALLDERAAEGTRGAVILVGHTTGFQTLLSGLGEETDLNRGALKFIEHPKKRDSPL